MTHYTRAAWGARAAGGGPGALAAARVEGIAIHWPAMAKPVREFAAVASALRGWQSYHMDGRGYSDIAYQVAVDQDGNRYELRGLRTQSGANGDTSLNQRFGAVLLILAPGERPTDAMVAEVRDVVADFRDLYPGAGRIVGHGQIRVGGTACPGPAAQSAIDKGVFEPVKKPGPVTRGVEVDKMIRLGRRHKKKIRHPKGTRARLLQRALNHLRRITPKEKP